MDKEALCKLMFQESPCYNFSDSCISCGWQICDHFPWLSTYQASKSATGQLMCYMILLTQTESTPIVYSTPEGTELSGIFQLGSKEHDEWNGPPDSRLSSFYNGPWGVMVYRRPAKAYVIHSCCWPLLTRHFANDEMNLDRLFKICRNRPASRTEEYMGSGNFSELWDNLQHPLQGPTIRGIGNATTQISKIQRLDISAAKHIIPGTDRFGVLPMEVRLEIAAYLSTVDFLSLRSISRIMAPVFSLQSFWKTRFRIDGDRGFLASLTNHPSKRKNWRSIYHCTAKIEKLYLHNWSMRRRWRNDCWLRDRYSMTPNPGGKTGSDDNVLGEVAWKVAAAEVCCERVYKKLPPRKNPAPCTYYQEEPIPMLHIDLLPGHIGLTVFILKEGTSAGTTTHIIGFDLISADVGTRNMTLGYRLPGSQVTVDLCNRNLRGFKVITDDRGIRALRPVFNGETVTSWIGDPEQDRTTNLIQIILKDGVKHIAAKFDVSLS
jgi:hypothetical protein